MSYEDKGEEEEFMLWGYRFMATITEINAIGHMFRSKPGAAIIRRIEAEIEWHTYNPKGDLAEISLLTERLHALELSMHEDIAKWMKGPRIPEGI